MALPIAREKLGKAFFLLSIIIIIVLAALLFGKRFGLFFKKAPFSLKLVRIIGSKEGLKGPAGVAFGKRNDIYVVDSGNSRVVKFGIKGNYIRQWGIEGKTSGEFMVPLFASAYGNPERIYVVDSGNSRIEVFKPDGRFVSEWGNAGNNAKTKLSEPTFAGFAYDKLYVANSGADDIIIYFKDGRFYERKGKAAILNANAGFKSGKGSGHGLKTGAADGADNKNGKNGGNGGNVSGAKPAASLRKAAVLADIFKKPVGLAFSKKYIYVSDYSLSKILVFNREFDYIGSIGTSGDSGYQLHHPVGIVYKNGYLYVANYGRSILTVFKLNDGFNVVKTYNFGTPGSGRRNFNHESNISISRGGKYLAVADTNNNRILIYRIFGAS